jgi:hypothetical protein
MTPLRGAALPVIRLSRMFDCPMRAAIACTCS